ncbi:MAG: LamG-like jellyroll fold domain-containing protein [Myxococcota bacterium]
MTGFVPSGGGFVPRSGGGGGGAGDSGGDGAGDSGSSGNGSGGSAALSPAGTLTQRPSRLGLSAGVLTRLGLQGSPLVTFDRQSIDLDGVSERIAKQGLPTALQDMSDTAWTVSLWFKADALASTTQKTHLLHISQQVGGSGRDVLAVYLETASQIKAIVSRGFSHFGVVNGTTTLAPGAWYHVAVTKPAGITNPRIYINGVDESVVNNTLSSSGGANPRLRYGCRSDEQATTFFDGRMTGLCFWTAELSGGAVAAITAGGLGFDPTTDGGGYDGASSLLYAYFFDRFDGTLLRAYPTAGDGLIFDEVDGGLSSDTP